MNTHIIRFPRWERDIRTKKRTLIHMPVKGPTPAPCYLPVDTIFTLLPILGSVGATAVFVQSIAHARIVRSEIVPAEEWVREDIRKLGVSDSDMKITALRRRWQEYRKRCVAIWGDGIAKVYRIEFQYVDAPPMPEECIAA